MAKRLEQLKALADDGKISDRELLEGLFAVSGFEKVTPSEFNRTTLQNPGMV